MTTSPTSKRVILVRKAHGFRAGEFAKHIGISPSRLANIEMGSPLSHDVAVRIVKAIPGLTLDWLYLNRAEGLTKALSDKLNKYKLDV